VKQSADLPGCEHPGPAGKTNANFLGRPATLTSWAKVVSNSRYTLSAIES
jgi:hypothetical protein